tara:strand:+ start:4742 stop:4951 length:210 start_codon:yes stop_codon:yes gene_type:complete
MCKVCGCRCDNCIACRANKSIRPDAMAWSDEEGKMVSAAGGCGCATPGHVDYMDCGCTEGGTENAWPEE